MLKKAWTATSGAVKEHKVAAVLFWIPFVGAALAAGAVIYTQVRNRNKRLDPRPAPTVDEAAVKTGLWRVK